MNAAQIRPVAICVFRWEDRILVEEYHEPEKRRHFYRPLGGGIEFGEYGQEAIVREIHEEIGAEIRNVRSLGMLENIFTLDGRVWHEIVLVYDAEFVDQSLYTRRVLTGADDGGHRIRAVWKRLDEFLDDQIPLYPDGLLRLLRE